MKKEMLLIAIACAIASYGQLNAGAKLIIENETEGTNFTDIKIECIDATSGITGYKKQKFNIGKIEAGKKVSKTIEAHGHEWWCDITVPQPKGSKAEGEDDMKESVDVDNTKDSYVFINSKDGKYYVKASQ